MNSGIVGLLGENGVGKTTLLHLISGLRFPKQGTCKVFGQDSYNRKPETLEKIFFLPEEFDTPIMSICTYAKYNAAFYPNFSQEQFEQYLAEFNVDGNEKMTAQSLGQKKKAMIAFALSLNTPILLLDEPTNGLDIPSKTQFRKILSAIADEGRLIIISSHQVRDLEALIDPIIILDHNEVLINNSIEEISSKLLFSKQPEKPENALYIEQMLDGYLVVEPNANNRQSIVNIEALFNFAISNKQKISELFNQKNY
jgi:ABC-2 type transport system ATP-binding protein